MGREGIRRVAIVGSGPTGSALATWLQRGGVSTVMFTRGKRPPIIVGESLVPAVIPFLRDLGVENEVAKYSMYKPGATFLFHPIAELSFRFAESRGARTYATTCRATCFDQTLLDAAAAGAKRIDHSVRIERAPEGDRIRLGAESLAHATEALGGAPDLIVDATGRARTVARLLDLPTIEGPRKDTALHAHCSGVETVFPGNVHSERMEYGWGWRIPLPGRVSVGFVRRRAPRDVRNGAEEQFDGFLRGDASRAPLGREGGRLTPVVHSNYQPPRDARGDGWALVGDAFGFVDPVFSSGALIGLDGAKSLSRALGGRPRDARRFEARNIRILDDWTRIVDAYYSGLFTLFRVGNYVRQTLRKLRRLPLRQACARLHRRAGDSR
jgi:flavin-dependent dehydrogenase